MRAALIRLTLALASLAALASCAQEREAELRARLDGWVYLGRTLHFESRFRCTAAVFEVALPIYRSAPARARSISGAVKHLHLGRPVIFDLVGRSPDALSSELMSTELSSGLGLVSNALRAGEDCLEGEMAAGFFRVITSEDALLLYDPENGALVLLYPPEHLALYMRGDV
ncbi:hypothetical protein [Allosediminivita pacifica]|uniref:Lipoprotein n=1 Tax=Allosediminivita pacifica TaxID=1267769 RepID=A0A2T6AJ71_9RHOB|nr:hypothetical protein [Allosediminivita pacifica]PTX43852.1 hypothetical protein C8N44_12464 [Allosediminivita pacifica]GGB22294.1 hypothetical protein GCM10011324_35420 [Allosediminivita pacifica]